VKLETSAADIIKLFFFLGWEERQTPKCKNQHAKPSCSKLSKMEQRRILPLDP
jgi:hypothetical protein